jgi:hypothetical protein
LIASSLITSSFITSSFITSSFITSSFITSSFITSSLSIGERKMMKKLLMSIGVLALSASVIAGGDDRDRGPVESLDAIASPTPDKPILS